MQIIEIQDAATAVAEAGRPSSEAESATVERRSAGVPRLGFLGVGWIGRKRMESIAQAGAGEIAGIADAVPEAAMGAAGPFEGALVCRNFDDLLRLDLDGIVIATPSALHAEQTISALQ